MSLDPFVELFAAANEERQKRQREHDALRASPDFVRQSRRLERLTYDFAHTLRMCWLASTRNREFAENSFFLRNIEALNQSALMTAFAIREGYLNPGRRELRFLIELAVHALFTDEQMGVASFEAHREFFRRKGEKTSLENALRLLAFDLIPGLAEDFRTHVVRVWANASEYVHPSSRQLDERFRLAEEGVTLGFESVAQLRAAVDEVAKGFGIGIVLAFHAVGPSFAADLLVDNLDEIDAWSFHRDRFVAAMDERYDYKHERQARLDQIKRRRALRLSLGVEEIRVALLGVLRAPLQDVLNVLRARFAAG